MAFECMDDCIHLKACRRIQKIGKKHRLMVPRYCTEDCSAYQSGNKGEYCTVDEAWRIAVNQYDGRNDPYDVYARCDFPSNTLLEILEQEGK
jgi:hypothetical protein